MVAAQPVRKRPPDTARVIETYLHECQSKGKWGAYKRTGERYGRTDEWARKLVHRHHHARPAPEPTLTYTPAPGEVAYIQERNALAAEALLCELVAPELPTPVPPTELDIKAPVSLEIPNYQPPERPKYQLFEFNVPAVRGHNDSQFIADLTLGIAFFMTLLVILVTTKTVALALMLLLPVLGLWWVAAEAQRDLRQQRRPRHNRIHKDISQ